ncbi:MAG TPA: 50S ribosomal protein L17 [Spirochaetota bacterium]|nr:50S ribosomal protein L17 [Spirochaetota bacterium]
MRHLKKGKRLGRDKEHREAMFANLIVSFLQNERIKTTITKAKELRRRSERIITRAKDPTLHNKRIVLSRIKDRDMVAKLFDDIAPRYKNVNGGYTRIIRIGRRQGDGAELSYLELVETAASGSGKKTKKKETAEAPVEKKTKKKETAEAPTEKKTKKKEEGAASSK